MYTYMYLHVSVGPSNQISCGAVVGHHGEVVASRHEKQKIFVLTLQTQTHGNTEKILVNSRVS